MKISLENYLGEKDLVFAVGQIVLALSKSFKEIYRGLKFGDKGKVGTENAYGEEQLRLDVLSDQIVTRYLKETGMVGLIASEERTDALELQAGEYAVAHDPLDGSSLVDVNLSVGTICGIYKTDNFIGKTGRDQIASVVACYGPNLGFFLTFGQGVAYFVLNPDGEFVLEADDLRIADHKKIFAPGNLRACAERQDYQDLMDYWMKNSYTLRYSGGMVPDIGQILLKGGGVFVYPGFSEQPDGKLRLLYECLPVAFLIEQAGGLAKDGEIDILDKEIRALDQRSEVFVGGKEDVELVEKFLFSSDRSQSS